MIYIFYGFERGEKNTALQSIKQELVEKYGDLLEVSNYYLGQDKISSIITQLDNGELFASQNLVIIQNAEVLKTKDILKFLPYSKSPKVTLVFDSDAEWVDKGFKQLPAKLQSFPELGFEQKKRWVHSYLQTNTIEIEEEALELFLSIVSGNTLEYKQELDKLINYFALGSNLAEQRANTDQARIKVENVEALYHSKEESVYTLFEAFLSKNFSLALRILLKLLETKDYDETTILIRLAQNFRQVAGLRSIIEQKGGRSHQSLQYSDFVTVRVFGNKLIALFKSAIQKISPQELSRALVICTDFEMMLRQSKTGIHQHISLLWLYALFFKTWKPKLQKEDQRMFASNHRRFER